MSLTKRDIVKKVASKLWNSEAKSKKIVNDLIEILKRTLQSGDDVLISGFGKFCVKEKRERKGRNPNTGENIILPRRRVVTFKCSQILRNKIKKIDELNSMGLDSQSALNLMNYVDRIKKRGLEPEPTNTRINDLINFANKITPPSWIIHKYDPNLEFKPGNLDIEIDAMDVDYCEELFESGESIAWVKGPMLFQKISSLANAGDKRALSALKKYGDGTFAKMKINICLEVDYCVKCTLVHELSHIAATRRLAQRMHAGKLDGAVIPNHGGDDVDHGPVFQWAFALLIDRVRRFDDNRIAEELREELRHWRNGTIRKYMPFLNK